MTENLTITINDAASNPKIATAVAAGTASVGAAGQLGIITGWMATGSLAIGLITAAVVLVIQIIKLKITLLDLREHLKNNNPKED